MRNFYLERFGLFISLVMLTFILTLTAPCLDACTVPVFRYALERWEADTYVIEVVPPKAGLGGEARAAAELLESFADGKKVSVNFKLRYVGAEKSAKGTPASGGAKDGPDKAQLNVYFPRPRRVTRKRKPVWSEPLTTEAVKKLVDSPFRRELVQRLIGGDSAVWILLESGDKQKDDAAAELLEKQLHLAQNTLKLPEQKMLWEDDTAFSEGEVALRIAFSWIRLIRNDPEEAFLVSCLLRTEPDLLDFNEPMAFPVFGRGIVLYALIGKGINQYNIWEACDFITGACSCVVKGLNPGVDLLTATDWDKALESLPTAPQPSPPLVGVTDLVAPEKGPPAAEPNADILPKMETEPASGALRRGVLIVLGLSIAFVIIGSYLVKRKKWKVTKVS